MKKLLLSLLLGVMLLGTGCEKDSIPLQSISFIDIPATAGIGQPIKLSLKNFPENADASYTLEWTIDKTLADFDESTQTLTRKANGPVTVTVNVKGRPEINAAVTINPIIALSVSFENPTLDVKVGVSSTVKLIAKPIGADIPEIIWKISGPNKATFDEITKKITLSEKGAAVVEIALKSKPEKVVDKCIIKDDYDITIESEYLRDYWLWHKQELDRNNDGKIQYSEVALLTFYNIFRSPTTLNACNSLKGIEYFASLKKLICTSERITELDLSQNHNLTYLRCYSNKMTKLSLGNISKLDTIECQANLLTTLDVSNNKSLSKLICLGNKLSTLDISNNKSLTVLYCCNNNLSTLDISNNNKITSADFTGNPNLTTIYVWKGFIPTEDFKKDATATYVEVP